MSAVDVYCGIVNLYLNHHRVPSERSSCLLMHFNCGIFHSFLNVIILKKWPGLKMPKYVF